MNPALVRQMSVYETINRVLISGCNKWGLQMESRGVLLRRHSAFLCLFALLSLNQTWNNKQEFTRSDLIPARVSYDNGGLHVISCMIFESLCRPLSLPTGCGRCF